MMIFYLVTSCHLKDKGRGLTRILRESNYQRMDFRQGESRLTCTNHHKVLGFQGLVLSVVEKAEAFGEGILSGVV